MKIEAVFGGILSLFVLGVVVFAVLSGRFGGRGGNGDFEPLPGDSRADMTVCECYKDGFDLSADYDVLSPEYGTHYILCRETLGERGGKAFTAGWNARRSSTPWESSCESYERRGY